MRFVCLFRLKNTGHRGSEPGHTVQTDDRKRTTRRHLDELTVRIDGQDIEDTVGGHMGSPVDGSKP